MLFRFGKCLLLFLFFVGVSSAQNEQDQHWLQQSREILNEAASKNPPEWLLPKKSTDALFNANQIATQSGVRREPLNTATIQKGKVIIFASASIPDSTLKNLLLQATEDDVVFVLRGLIKDTNIRGTLNKLRNLLPAEDGKVPNVIIDPTLFRRFNIQVVPTMVLTRGEGNEPVIATGAITVDWLKRKAKLIKADDEPHLGKRGEVYNIAEVDLVLEMQRRIANIDWNKRRDQALQNYWADKQDFVDLPTATENRQFIIDPTVQVTKDIVGKDGEVLVKAGQTFNPLDLVPMTKTVLVFRGTDIEQVNKVSEIADSIRRQGRGVILLTTVVDTDQGWKSIGNMERDLNSPVYLLLPNLARRFNLQHVPSMIEGRDNRLVIKEIAMVNADAD